MRREDVSPATDAVILDMGLDDQVGCKVGIGNEDDGWSAEATKSFS